MNDEEQARYYLRTLHYWIGQLRWFIAASDSTEPLSELDERERESFPFEWDDVVGRVKRAQMLADAGALEPDGVAELRGIAEELTELLPTMQWLRLRVPDLDALARSAGRPAASQTS